MTDDNFPVEVDVPPPVNRRRRYPFDKLEVNQSFFVPIGEGFDEVAATKAAATLSAVLSTSARRVADDTGREFTTRKRVENGRLGIRVWRTA